MKALLCAVMMTTFVLQAMLPLASASDAAPLEIERTRAAAAAAAAAEVTEAAVCPRPIVGTTEHLYRVADLEILHFNDVYNIRGKETGGGGAARFATAVKQFNTQLMLFSGDALNPSIFSNAKRGMHMLDVLNELGVDCATFGNHDFDFGIENAKSIASQSRFPWLLANALDADHNCLLGGAKATMMIERAGLKIGIIGLGDQEWIETLAHQLHGERRIVYLDYLETARPLARQLREQEGADVVIALTHMRRHHDRELAKHVPEIDLVLGGHDHDYGVESVRAATDPAVAIGGQGSATLLVKSGCDFAQFSHLELWLHSRAPATRTPLGAALAHKLAHSARMRTAGGGDRNVQCQVGTRVTACATRVDVTEDVAADARMAKIVADHTDLLMVPLKQPVGYVPVPLDARSEAVRSKESAIGNLVCDAMFAQAKKVLGHVDIDVALLNGGAIRSERVIGPGLLTKRDIVEALSFGGEVVALNITGAGLLAAMENGVSRLPSHEGRFPHLSRGAHLVYDPHGTPGQRVRRFTINGRDVRSALSAYFVVVTIRFLAEGGDNYASLKNSRSSAIASSSSSSSASSRVSGASSGDMHGSRHAYAREQEYANTHAHAHARTLVEDLKREGARDHMHGDGDRESTDASTPSMPRSIAELVSVVEDYLAASLRDRTRTSTSTPDIDPDSRSHAYANAHAYAAPAVGNASASSSSRSSLISSDHGHEDVDVDVDRDVGRGVSVNGTRDHVDVHTNESTWSQSWQVQGRVQTRDECLAAAGAGLGSS